MSSKVVLESVPRVSRIVNKAWHLIRKKVLAMETDTFLTANYHRVVHYCSQIGFISLSWECEVRRPCRSYGNL